MAPYLVHRSQIANSFHQGLRGVASFVVVLGHLCTSFLPHLHAPALNLEGDFALFQLPILRLLVGGRSAVAMFFLITGYVNSLGPLSKIRNGDVDGAYSNIARSALARSGRLILPTMIATFITWLFAQLNAYQLAQHVDAIWIKQGWHPADGSILGALCGLARAETGTWTSGWNEYDGTQWTLILFLEGSMMVYMTMMVATLVTPRARVTIFGVLYVYGWLCAKGQIIAS